MSDDLHPLTSGTDMVPFAVAVEPRTCSIVGTDFLMFGVGGGANVEAQADYQNDAQRPTGNLPGLARSNFNNKAIRQGTFVAHSLCLWISEQINQYIPDDGNDIAWIGEFSAALAQFILSLMPPSPNLGAYLPLAGGNMSGNITFNTGVSTILNNNTWYYGRDTGGTARGLILKGSDNNIYISDGSCPYIMLNGSPILQNNTWYGARSTTNSLHGVIGILSDNATHIASGPAAHIYLDVGVGGSVWTNGNIVINNAQFYYSKTADGNPRGVLGITSGNELQIGGGHPWTTSIYSGGGQYIYMRSTTNFLNQIIVNQYSYLNGGGRAYIPGGNDPWQIYADNGFYSRTHFIVGGTRDWTAGCLRGGTFGIADESAAAMRFEIDLNGHVHCYNNLYAADCSFGGVTTTAFHATSWGQIDGGLTVYNGLNIPSGNLSISGGTYAYGGITVYGGLYVSASATVTGDAQVNGRLTVYNGINMAAGTMYVNGQLYAYSNATVYGTLVIGGTGGLYDGGNNWINCNANFNCFGAAQVGSDLNIYGNGYTQGWQIINGGLRVGYTGPGPNGDYNSLRAEGPVVFVSWLDIGGRIYIETTAQNSCNGGWNIGDGGHWTRTNMYRDLNMQGDGVVWRDNGRSYWDVFSDRRFKADIKPYRRGLADIRKLDPVDYMFLDPVTQEPTTRSIGLIADDVEQIMPEMVFERDSIISRGDPTVVKMMNTSSLQFALVNAIKELVERLEKLEAA